MLALPVYSKLPSVLSVKLPLRGEVTGVVSTVSVSRSMSLSLANKPGTVTNKVPSAFML